MAAILSRPQCVEKGIYLTFVRVGIVGDNGEPAHLTEL